MPFIVSARSVWKTMVLQKLINPSGIRPQRRVKFLISMLIIASFTVSCGQKGPLRMPEQKQDVTEQSTDKPSTDKSST